MCFYVKGQSASRNSRLDTDEIIIIVAGTLHVIETKFLISEDVEGAKVTALVTLDIDTDNLEKLLEQAVKERGFKK